MCNNYVTAWFCVLVKCIDACMNVSMLIMFICVFTCDHISICEYVAIATI